MRLAVSEKVWSKQIPKGRWDYIVVGSGMGGMTAAAMLAKLGKRVLVLEQHYVAGGFTHMFKRPGYVWDVGVHAVGEVTEHSMTGRLLATLTDGKLEWAPLGEVYDEFHYPGGFRIDFPNTPQKLRDNLERAFPKESRAIHDYLNEVREVSGAMKGYYLARVFPERFAPLVDRVLARQAKRHLQRRTGDVIGALTDDPKLRAVFAAQWGYYGSTPKHSSFAIQALVVKHFQWGGYYPVGGAKRIAETLLGTVAESGGATAIRADVESILVEDGVAKGVRMRGGDEIRADAVISAAGCLSTVLRLLPESERHKAWARSIAELRPAKAHVCLYLGFKGDIRSAGAGPANKWFYETWDMEDEAWDILAPGARAPCLYSSFPSLKDPHHDPGPEEKHTGEVVTFVPWDAFERWRTERWQKRGEDYEALKEDLQKRMLAQFLGHLPGLEKYIDWVELSTPVSTEHFARPVQGSIYGIEPTPERFKNRWLRPRAPIGNLFFAGSDVATVGVIGAMMGGVLCAAACEPSGTFKLLRAAR
jgi:all-trans-retinol 13,14-reductase